MELKDTFLRLYYDLVASDARDVFLEHGKLPVLRTELQVKGEELSKQLREIVYEAYTKELLVPVPEIVEGAEPLFLYNTEKLLIVGVEKEDVTAELLLEMLIEKGRDKENPLFDYFKNTMEKKERAKAIQLAYETEKKHWIKEHGSHALKQLAKDGFPANSLYIKERMEMEFPDFTYQPLNTEYWREEESPTDTHALNEFRKVLTRARKFGVPRENISLMSKSAQHGEKRYAIWIRNYLNQNGAKLVKELAPKTASDFDEFDEKVGLTI